MKNRHIRRGRKNQAGKHHRQQLPKLVAQFDHDPDPAPAGRNEWPGRSPNHPSNLEIAEQRRLQKKQEEAALIGV